MKQPLWAINSSLLIFTILGQLAYLFLHIPIPRRAPLEPTKISMADTKVSPTIDIVKIYGINDLFETYTPEIIASKVIEPDIPIMPQVPNIIPLTIPIEAPKVFIPPLPVTLKGVMYMHDNPTKSVAIVQFQNSKEELNYHVGQLINDAQILKIYPNRIIVVRSNGQKETLYLREDDAEKSFFKENSKEILSLIIPTSPGIYKILVKPFITYVKNLGEFIDLLDLTTVYQKGKSIGCRVGKAEKDSLGAKLGFMYDDIIQKIDNLPITDIASRVLAFDHIMTKKINDDIVVQVQREKQTIILKYELIEESDHHIKNIGTNKSKNNIPIDPQFMYNIEEEQKKLLAQKVKFAPTAHQLEIEERKRMLQARHNDMILKKQQQRTAISNQSTGVKG